MSDQARHAFIPPLKGVGVPLGFCKSTPGPILPAQALARHALGLERRISDLVHEAYRLTPDEVALMWETAPPRMPISAP